MIVTVKAITPPRKSNRLADVTIELSDGNGHSVEITDLRILRAQKTQELWVGVPSFSIPNSHKGWDYVKTCEFSRALFREIESAVLDAYAEWIEKNGGAR